MPPNFVTDTNSPAISEVDAMFTSFHDPQAPTFMCWGSVSTENETQTEIRESKIRTRMQVQLLLGGKFGDSRAVSCRDGKGRRFQHEGR